MLDREVEAAVRSGTELLLVLGSTPTWASARPNEIGCCKPDAPRGNAAEVKDLAEWRNYVLTVASRYKGRVRHYELWNEPNVNQFYSGSVEKLVELNREAYRVLKEVDPSIVVVSSSLSRCCEALKYLDKYFALGGGKWADVVGFHFYPAPKPPEAMIPLVWQVKELMVRYGVNKPLWNTETGWRILNHNQNIEADSWAGPALSDNESIAYLMRTFLLSWAAGIERLYWYAWGHNSMGMTEYGGRIPKPIATAFTDLQHWMVGAEMLTCEQVDNGTWIAAFSRSGKPFWIVWNPEGTVGYSPPASWRIAGWSTLAGERFSIDAQGVVTIGPVPVRLDPIP
jgi:hypothetical protein